MTPPKPKVKLAGVEIKAVVAVEDENGHVSVHAVPPAAVQSRDWPQGAERYIADALAADYPTP
jgi:hypothetical protein